MSLTSSIKWKVLAGFVPEIWIVHLQTNKQKISCVQDCSRWREAIIFFEGFWKYLFYFIYSLFPFFRSSLFHSSVDPISFSGTYVCEATNGFGQPAQDSIRIAVKRNYLIFPLTPLERFKKLLCSSLKVHWNTFKFCQTILKHALNLKSCIHDDPPSKEAFHGPNTLLYFCIFFLIPVPMFPMASL